MLAQNPPKLAVVPYLTDALNTFAPCTLGSATLTVNTDWLAPFSVREPVTIDGVFWYRDSATAANVYVGIYDKDLNLLTDCAVDADTTAAAYHVVPTTPVTLLPGKIYYHALNQSVLVAMRGTGDANLFAEAMSPFATRPDMVAAPNIDPVRRMYLKARANGALLNPAVLSGWTPTNLFAVGGFVKA